MIADAMSCRRHLHGGDGIILDVRKSNPELDVHSERSNASRSFFQRIIVGRWSSLRISHSYMGNGAAVIAECLITPRGD